MPVCVAHGDKGDRGLRPNLLPSLSPACACEYLRSNYFTGGSEAGLTLAVEEPFYIYIYI